MTTSGKLSRIHPNPSQIKPYQAVKRLVEKEVKSGNAQTCRVLRHPNHCPATLSSVKTTNKQTNSSAALNMRSR